MAFSEALAFRIVYVVLAGVFIKPLFILWLLSLCMARRKSDPARTGFLWVKFVFPLEVLALVLYVISGAASVVYLVWTEPSSSFSDDDFIALTKVNVRTGSTGALFEKLADICLIIAVAELGIGFLYVLAQKRTGLQKIIRYSAFAVGGVLSVLTLAWFGKLEATWTQYFNYVDGRGTRAAYLDINRNFKISLRLAGAVDILFWIASMPMIALASFVVHKHKRMLSKSAILLLVATTLNFVRHTWFLVYTAHWVLADDPPDITNAFYVVEPLCNIWPFFVLLVLLFALGTRKREGLWSTQQSWMDNLPVTYAYPQQQQQMYQPYPPQLQQLMSYPPQQTTYGVPPQQGFVQQPEQRV